MSKIQIFKLDREKSNLINKLIGGFLIVASFLLMLPYLYHFFKIFVALFFLAMGVFFLTKETRFRWFRIRRF